jgi:hypothetical protein
MAYLLPFFTMARNCTPLHRPEVGDQLVGIVSSGGKAFLSARWNREVNSEVTVSIKSSSTKGTQVCEDKFNASVPFQLNVTVKAAAGSVQSRQQRIIIETKSGARISPKAAMFLDSFIVFCLSLCPFYSPFPPDRLEYDI